MSTSEFPTLDDVPREQWPRLCQAYRSETLMEAARAGQLSVTDIAERAHWLRRDCEFFKVRGLPHFDFDAQCGAELERILDATAA